MYQYTNHLRREFKNLDAQQLIDLELNIGGKVQLLSRQKHLEKSEFTDFVLVREYVHVRCIDRMNLL